VLRMARLVDDLLLLAGSTPVRARRVAGGRRR
jgi:hypothetical protein